MHFSHTLHLAYFYIILCHYPIPYFPRTPIVLILVSTLCSVLPSTLNTPQQIDQPIHYTITTVVFLNWDHHVTGSFFTFFFANRISPRSFKVLHNVSVPASHSLSLTSFFLAHHNILPILASFHSSDIPKYTQSTLLLVCPLLQSIV